jgi:hypothetical protein
LGLLGRDVLSQSPALGDDLLDCIGGVDNTRAIIDEPVLEERCARANEIGYNFVDDGVDIEFVALWYDGCALLSNGAVGRENDCDGDWSTALTVPTLLYVWDKVDQDLDASEVSSGSEPPAFTSTFFNDKSSMVLKNFAVVVFGAVIFNVGLG